MCSLYLYTVLSYDVGTSVDGMLRSVTVSTDGACTDVPRCECVSDAVVWACSSSDARDVAVHVY